MHRRSFLITASATGACAVLGGCRAQAAERALSLGFIGVGSRGQDLIRHFLSVPLVRVGAVCDVYPPRFDEVRRALGADVPVFADYRALLDRHDVDAIVVATPPKLHREQVIAALGTGKPVYGEKSLAFTVEDCDAVRAAAAHRVFQVGHQWRHASWFARAVARVRAGELGTVTHVDGYWHRNASWRRALPKADRGLEKLLNWRLHRATSGGLMMELGAHQIDVANWIFDDLPESVIGEGGIDYYQDGRDVNDNVKAIFRYPGGRTFSFSAITTNAEKGFQIWIYGTKGSARLTPEDATFFSERRVSPPPVEVVTGASKVAGAERSCTDPEEVVRARPEVDDPTTAACRAFCDAARGGARPAIDAQVGWGAAMAVLAANRAIDEGRRVRLAEVLGRNP